MSPPRQKGDYSRHTEPAPDPAPDDGLGIGRAVRGAVRALEEHARTGTPSGFAASILARDGLAEPGWVKSIRGAVRSAIGITDDDEQKLRAGVGLAGEDYAGDAKKGTK